MAYDNMIYDQKDSIAMVTINRPPANSWSMAAMEDLEKILDEIEKDQQIRVVIISGAGEKCFSAGMDVADAAKSPGIGDKGRALWRRVDRFEKPIMEIYRATIPFMLVLLLAVLIITYWPWLSLALIS